ncbi:hypothetical protein FSP39_013616 [Pinctada imbricata]|uniref:2'-phosphotransferase n=1 Tax=Pinctada imbricata TaxID=66713 RepID=A0AA89BX26_PINIB|nr:hypothetical protein FSP39_013616 [Pinctada imbricata]
MAHYYIGRKMVKMLRHRADAEGLDPDREGFVDLDTLLKHQKMRNYSYQDVVRAIAVDDKMRFQAAKIGDREQIRAVQGHTMDAIRDQTQPVRSLSQLPTFDDYGEYSDLLIHPFHRTTYDQWERIRHHGLCRRFRKYVTFAYGQPMDDSVFIYLDVIKAFDDGLPLYIGSDYLFCSGDDSGYIRPYYFSAVDINGQRIWHNY